MKKVILIFIIIFLVVQALFLNFDNLADFSENKQTYINMLIGVLALIIILMDKKSH